MKQNELDKFNKIVDEQVTKAMQKHKSKQLQKEKIERILGQTVSKLKIETIDMNQRFQQRFFKELSSLKTFVNAQKQLQQLNLLGDDQVLRQIEQAKKMKELQEIDDQKIIYQLKKDQQYQDLHISQEIFQKQKDHLNKISQKRIRSIQSQNSLDFIEKDEIFDIIDEKIRQNKQWNELNSRNTQECFFYEKVKPEYHNHSQERDDKQKDKKSIHYHKMIENLRNQYGIDIEKDHCLGDGMVYKKFLQNSQRVLRKIKHSSLEKYKQTEENSELRQRILEQQKKRERKYFKKQIQAHDQYGMWNNVEKKGFMSQQNLLTEGKEKEKKESYQQRYLEMRVEEMNMIYININSIQAQVKHLNSDMKKDYKSSNKMMKRMENDMDMIEKKYDMNGKLVKLGFNTHDINLNLKKDLKQNINMASKNFRKLKIIKYY